MVYQINQTTFVIFNVILICPYDQDYSIPVQDSVSILFQIVSK